MKPFRCQICGETYLGETRPDRCPYCGSPGHHLALAAEWIDHGAIPITDASREASMQALGFELSNHAFYLACEEKAELKINAALFARLADQEDEHAELIFTMIGLVKPEAVVAQAPDLDADKFAQAHAREHRAVLHYQRIVHLAPEARVREVFSALTEVESAHLRVTNQYR